MNSRSGYQLQIFLAFAAIYLVWGSTFTMVAIALKTFPPFVLNTFRFLIGGVILSVYCIYRKEPLPAWKDLGKFAITGIVVFMGGVVAVVWAQQYISSSVASIIITTPFWFMALDKRNWKTNFHSPLIIAGMLLCLAGVIILLLNKPHHHAAVKEGSPVLAILVIVTGSFLWAGGSLYLRYNPGHTSIYVQTATQLSAAGLLCLLIGLLTGSFHGVEWQHLHWQPVAAVLYMAIVSTTITFMAFVWLIRQKPPALVSTYSYVNPMVAVLLGALVLNERISIIQVICMIVILSGVFLINLPSYRAKKLAGPGK